MVAKNSSQNHFNLCKRFACGNKDNDNKLASNEQHCRWIANGEIVVIQGIKIVKGLIYIGDYFKLDENNRNKISDNSITLTPVINDKLGVSKVKSDLIPFDSYSTMTSYMRFLYLKWLAGEIQTKDVCFDYIVLYLSGIEYKLFFDKATSNEERITIIKEVILLENETKERQDYYEIEYDIHKIINDSICSFFYSKIDILPFKLSISELGDNYAERLLEDKLENNNFINGEKAYELANLLIDFWKELPLKYMTEIKEHFISIFDKTYGKITIIKNCPYPRCHSNLSNDNCSLFQKIEYGYDSSIMFYSTFSKCEILSAIKITHWQISRDFANNIKVNMCSGESLMSLMFLPDYIDTSKNEKIIKIRMKLYKKMSNNDFYCISVNELLHDLEYIRKDEKSLHKEYVTIIINSLQRWGYGIAPNYKYDNKRFTFGDQCVIYNIPQNIEIKNNEINAILIIFVKFASAIILSDTIKQNDDAYVYNVICKLEENDFNRKHIMAVFKWLLISKAKFDTRISKIIEVSFKDKIDQKIMIVNDLLGLSCIEGAVNSKRIETAKKKLPLFGLDVSDIHTRIHHLITGEADSFATIENENGSEQFSISKDKEHEFKIDEEKLNKITNDTAKSQNLLHEIFDEDESANDEDMLPTNNNQNLELLKILLSKELWNRKDVDKLCSEQGLILGAALEWINDYSFEKIGDAVIEDDGDTIEVNTDYKNQLI